MPATIRVFDPALCCPTGVCGPGVDPALARFASDLAWLEQQGVAVERFNLAQQPAAFAATPAVKEALARGVEVLPLVLVGDRVVAEGVYPSRETLAALAGVVVKKLATLPASNACGTSGAEAARGSGSKAGCC